LIKILNHLGKGQKTAGGGIFFDSHCRSVVVIFRFVGSVFEWMMLLFCFYNFTTMTFWCGAGKEARKRELKKVCLLSQTENCISWKLSRALKPILKSKMSLFSWCNWFDICCNCFFSFASSLLKLCAVLQSLSTYLNRYMSRTSSTMSCTCYGYQQFACNQT